MNRGILQGIDWWLIAPVSVLVLLSLTTLFSINVSFFKSQFVFLIISFLVFLFFSQINYRIVQSFSAWIYVISLAILFLVLLLGIESRGAIRWIDLLGLRIQFSETLKPFLAVALAAFLKREKTNLRTFVLALIFFIPLFIFIFLQPDLGNALLYFASLILTLFIAGFPMMWFLLSSIPIFAAVPVIWHFLHGYQKQRILTFINPAKDPLGTSYNAIQSVIAVGSGMIFGKGFGETTQSGLRFLPERHTDFIFASIAESLGFVGCAILFAAFGLLLYRIYLIFLNSDDKFCKVFSAIAFSLFLIEFFVNASMSMAIIPIVGVTLPFVSYGGSSLLSNFILLGILSSISRDTKTNTALEIK